MPVNEEQTYKKGTTLKGETLQRTKYNLHKKALIVVFFTVVRNVSKASPDHSDVGVSAKKNIRKVLNKHIESPFISIRFYLLKGLQSELSREENALNHYQLSKPPPPPSQTARKY